jgi:RNA polymerase sigma factor (sigma-70 family)
MWAAYDGKRATKAVAAHDNGNGKNTAGYRNHGSDSAESPEGPTALVSRYGGFVYWVAQYLAETAGDAEDVFERTFLAVESEYTNPRQYDSVGMRLARVVLNESFEKLRVRNASKLLRLSLEAEDNGTPMPRLVADWGDAQSRYGTEELRNIVHEGIRSMTPFARLIFLLRDVGDLRPEEIAELLHLSLRQAKSHVLRSRLQLREHLNEHFKLNFREKAQTV